MIIVLIAIIFTIVLMQNTGPITFHFLWMTIPTSKLVLFTLIAFVAFILGLLVSRPKKANRFNGIDAADGDFEKGETGTLSEEDRNYLN